MPAILHFMPGAAQVVEVPRRPTYADIEALPDHLRGEIIAGELIVSPRPAMPHIQAASALGAFLNVAFQQGLLGPGGWWIEFEPELHLGRDPNYLVVVPDIAGWRRASMPTLPMTPFLDQAPNWVCEVLSPGSVRTDRAAKLPFYGREGVEHVWLVDPLAMILEVYALDRGSWRVVHIYRGDDPIRAEPFDAVEIPLGKLWER